MKLNIIDICTSTLRSVNNTLSTMSQIDVTEMPLVQRQEISALVVMAPSDTFTSVVLFSQEHKNEVVKGGVILYIAKSNVEALFGSLGVTGNSPLTEITDISGEFCNVIAGGFKTEIVRLGYDEVQLSTPKNYSGSVSDSVDMSVTCKYRMSFASQNHGLLTIDVFMEQASSK